MTNEHHEHNYKITINGVELTVDHEILTYEEIISLAFPGHDPATIFSVTFEHAREPKEGELVAGQSVTVKNNTEIDVDDTGRS